MDIISKDIRNIENSIARYIFKKYIMKKPSTTTTTQSKHINPYYISNDTGNTNKDTTEDIVKDIDIVEDTNEDILEENETSILETQKKLNVQLYKEFCKKVFDLERHSFRILQDEVLKDDLKQMSIADKEYEINPKEYNINDNDILPDVLRCTYIRKYKHRYYRCKNKVINDDSDVCKKHENCENIYIDNYNNLLEQFTSN